MLSQCPDTSTFAPLSAKAVIGRTVEMVKGKTMISHLYETKNICGLPPKVKEDKTMLYTQGL